MKRIEFVWYHIILIIIMNNYGFLIFSWLLSLYRMYTSSRLVPCESFIVRELIVLKRLKNQKKSESILMWKNGANHISNALLHTVYFDVEFFLDGFPVSVPVALMYWWTFLKHSSFSKEASFTFTLLYWVFIWCLSPKSVSNFLILFISWKVNSTL